MTSEQELDEKHLRVPVWVMKGIFALGAGVVPWAVWVTASVMTLNNDAADIKDLETLVNANTRNQIQVQREIDELFFRAGGRHPSAGNQVEPQTFTPKGPQ